MIVLDATVLIGHFEPAHPHHDDATALLTSHLSQTFACSAITFAEIYTGAAQAGKADRLHRRLAALHIENLDLPAGAARRLGELRATTKLKMPDCCVPYTAEQHSAAIATFNDRRAAQASDLGLTSPANLRVQRRIVGHSAFWPNKSTFVSTPCGQALAAPLLPQCYLGRTAV